MFDSRDLPRRKLIVGVLGLTLVLVLVVGAPPSTAGHDPESPHAQTTLLARTSFTDDVHLQVRLKLDGRKAQVINVREPSQVITVRMVLDPGAPVNWHTHPGPASVSVVEGELTYVNADDCVKRIYGAGSAFIDPGQGNVHMAKNTSQDPTVLVATFFGVPPGQPPTNFDVQVPSDCEPF